MKQQKVGLGSSACVLVTLYATLSTFFAHPMCAEEVVSIYRATNTHSSGVDVLTSYYGGFVHVKDQSVSSVEFPSGIYLDTYSVGFSTQTAAMVDSFRARFDALPVSLQQGFIAAADTIAGSLTNHTDFFNATQNFTQIYRDIDAEAQLSIWSVPHTAMYRLATELGVLYKPSGAGGGDIGIAIATDPDDLKALRVKAVALPVTLLDLEKDTNGVRIEKTT